MNFRVTVRSQVQMVQVKESTGTVDTDLTNIKWFSSSTFRCWLLFKFVVFWMEHLWRWILWRKSLVHPASLGFMLELPPFLSVLHLGENNAVMESVGLTLPELNRVRLDHVAAPERSQDAVGV